MHLMRFDDLYDDICDGHDIRYPLEPFPRLACVDVVVCHVLYM